MPPVRSAPMPIKPLKTERTHEENQERAYIAASRRGDRSLEARVESARRASEIHKRRTGRSLRVTEQDVLNEEMYEEEDDDMPMQYRRLTAHLNTDSPDFNRQLAAFISSRVALQQAVEHVRAQQASMDPRWPRPINTAVQSSMQGEATTSLSAMSNSPRSPGTYRHSPYPPASARSDPATHSRKMSAPGTTMETGSSVSIQHPGSPSSHLRNSMDSQSLNQSSRTQQFRAGHSDQRSHESNQPNTWNDANLSPLATSLPRDTQMFLPMGFDPSDPFNPRLGSSGHLEKSSFGVKQNTFTWSPNFHASSGGMSQTLAPKSLETIQEWQTDHSMEDGEPIEFAPSAPFDMDDEFAEKLNRPNTGFFAGDVTGSGQATPAELDWSSFIDSSPWDENN